MNGEEVSDSFIISLSDLPDSAISSPGGYRRLPNTTHKEFFIIVDDYLRTSTEVRDKFLVKDEDVVTLTYPKPGKDSIS
jgi:hypothetical protein